MTPAEFIAIGHKLYGRKAWATKMAADLGVDRMTIYRMTHRPQVKGPYEVALRGLLEHRRRQVELEKAARKLLPRKLRYKKKPPRSSTGRLLIRAAGDTDE